MGQLRSGTKAGFVRMLEDSRNILFFVYDCEGLWSFITYFETPYICLKGIEKFKFPDVFKKTLTL